MYSVEDLLISHGYKVSGKTSVPPSRSSSSHGTAADERTPARSSSRCETGEKRTAHAAVNGFKADSVYGSGGVGQTPSKGGPGDTDGRDRKQRTEEDDNGNLGDGHSPGDNPTTDSGFPESHRRVHPQATIEGDVSYWRRRGQDFNMLLDYSDFKDPHGKRLDVLVKAEGMPRRPESALSSEEHRRERQRRVDSARARERELALYQWRMAAERKYQSLGTEEWRPAVGIGRQMSESEGDRWAQEQRRPRTAEGAVPSRTKAKSQSLPRMAIPSDSLQYLSTSPSCPDLYGSYRINGHQSREPHKRNLSEGGSRERWHDNGRAGAQSAPPSKPRFSRPLRPPSYEVHQQMRGSSEMLSGEFMPHSRDRTPLPFSRQEYFAQVPGGSGMEPPGYIPPPSYRRQTAIRGGHRTYASSMGNYQYRGDPYMQGPAMTEVQEWFMRQTGMSWPDHHRDVRRTTPCRRQAYPGYSDERTGSVQYIPFDDPRVRHISGAGTDGNSLTDADKIRNIRKEIPPASLSEKSPDDRAFLLPEKPLSSTQACKSNNRDCVNDAVVDKEVSGQVSSSKSVSDQNSDRFSASHDYSNTFHMASSEHSSSSNQVCCDTVTQVKKFEAQTAAENKKNKKKLKETMFCLVSVPISVIASKETADPNNNEKVPSSVVASPENTATKPYGETLSNISITYDPQPSSSSATKSSIKAPVRKETVDVWSHQASAHKTLCYAGSWPGDQYKNQETQTGSPEVCRNVQPQSHHSQPMYEPPFLDTTTGSVEGTESSANYGYPMKGQKNLNFSSNSAFSQTTAGSSVKSSVQSPAQLVTAPTVSSPDRQPPLTKSAPKPPAPDGQEVWGQFLLKPVNRRPWDAIGELESINKELQDHNNKPPSTDHTIEDLDEALQNILEISNICTEAVRPGRTPHTLKREAVNQPHIEQSPERYFKRDNLNIRSDVESKGIIEADREYREVRSAFSRPKGRFTNPDIPQRQHNSVPKDSGFVNYEVVPRIQGDPGVQRLDIPVPKESLLKDVGLTVYTAIPDTVTSESPAGLSPESPMLTSPSDISDTYDTLQITSSDSGGDHSRNSPEFSVDHRGSEDHFSAKPDHDPETERTKAAVNSQRSPSSPRSHVDRSQRFRHKASYDDDDLYSDYVSWSDEKTLADEHLETLLSQEKANSLPTEDLSNLYQVQCAKGIPVHESIEQRAARILGIAVSVEALVSHDDGEGCELNADGTNEAVFPTQTREGVSTEGTWDVRRERVEVNSHEPKMEKRDPDVGKDNGSGEDKLVIEDHAVSVMVELPEFPPANLHLSLPVNEDEELALSVCGGEKKTWNVPEISDGQPDRCTLTAHPPSLMLKYEDLSVEHSSGAVEGDPVSRVNNLIKEIGGEEVGEERTELLDREEKILEGDKETEERKERIEEWEAAIEEEKDEDYIVRDELKEQREASRPVFRPVPQPRSGRVAKREITLPESYSVTTLLTTVEDEDILPVSETYDPSRVERV
ncbi:junctional cadherin 5-associated protein isoform X2 [Brachyhypopomus gauderio]